MGSSRNLFPQPRKGILRDEDKARVASHWEKVEQVLSTIQVLCFTLKEFARTSFCPRNKKKCIILNVRKISYPRSLPNIPLPQNNGPSSVMSLFLMQTIVFIAYLLPICFVSRMNEVGNLDKTKTKYVTQSNFPLHLKHLSVRCPRRRTSTLSAKNMELVYGRLGTFKSACFAVERNIEKTISPRASVSVKWLRWDDLNSAKKNRSLVFHGIRMSRY